MIYFLSVLEKLRLKLIFQSVTLVLQATTAPPAGQTASDWSQFRRTSAVVVGTTFLGSL